MKIEALVDGFLTNTNKNENEKQNRIESETE